MSCSKIFSGDLPELTYEVIKYLKDDISTLYSCILVNRLWCRLAIPLLWENPFSFRIRNHNVIEIYLNNLNDDLKTKLDEYKINDNPLPSNTLFNYPSFLKYLNIFDIVSYIEVWFIVAVRTSKPGNRYFLKDLSSCSILNFKRLINISLFKIFIENGVNLHTLEIEFSNTTYYNIYFNIILELILQNTNFIHNIKNLNLYIDSSFYFSNDHSNEYELIKNRTSQIINLHQNLKKISSGYNDYSFYESLLLSKSSNCTNTLNTIIFYYVDFKSIINLDKIFEQLNVLESIHIIYCSTLNTGFTKQIINLTKPFKLKSLILNERSQIDESFQLLLQKSGSYLENFGFGSLKEKSLELIIKYCKNIRFLDFYGYEDKIIYLAFNLIENIKQNLNYLTINVCKSQLHNDNNNFERSSIILRNLGQTLPSKLEYLSLILHTKASDLEEFLKNSQNTFIKKLLINNYMREDIDIDILPYVKEYIMKKKRVEYLAIMDSFFEKDPKYAVENGDLSYLKGEVEEFKLHNVKVRSYYDLAIFNVYDFIKKIG